MGIDREIVAYHKPKSLKDLVIPSRTKDCEEPVLQASTYAGKQIGKVEVVEVQDRLNEIVLDDAVSIDMRNTIQKTFELVGRGIHYNSYKKKFVLRSSEITDGSVINVGQKHS